MPEKSRTKPTRRKPANPTKKKLEQAKLELELQEVEYATNMIKMMNNSEAQRLAQPDPDDHLWIQHGSEMAGGKESAYDHYAMLDKVYDLYTLDLYSRAIVRNLSKFVLGRGAIVKPNSDNGKVLEVWNDFTEQNMWQIKEKEMVRRTFRDGELFCRFFVDDSTGDIAIRFVRAQSIRNPEDNRKHNAGENVSFGIGTDPEDVENVKTYYQCGSDGNLLHKVDASEIMHIKILTDSDVKRGMSFLLVAMKMLKKYGEWLDDRFRLNKVRSAIALIRKVEGTAGTVESLRDKYKSIYQDADKNKQQAFRSGTVLTASGGVSYEMLAPKINAPDVKDDGRAMLLSVAAGVGFPEMFLTADFANANYSSSLVAQNPFVREIEDWQDFFAVYYKQIFKRVIEASMKYGDLPENENADCTVEFPPLILADIFKNNQAREIQSRNKIISHKTWQLKEGLDPEEERRNIEEEQAMDIYKQPFDLPIAPTNQWGSLNEDEE